jgi:hypothetical protein
MSATVADTIDGVKRLLGRLIKPSTLMSLTLAYRPARAAASGRVAASAMPAARSFATQA